MPPLTIRALQLLYFIHLPSLICLTVEKICMSVSILKPYYTTPLSPNDFFSVLEFRVFTFQLFVAFYILW